MKTIELALHPIDGYLMSITRDPEHGWYVLEIGLPITWVYDENTKIGCEVTEEYEQGKFIKIFPKKTGIVIDDLVAFVEIIIVTNEKIAAKEKEFTDSLEEKKTELENWAKGFYKEMDELKENSFKTLNKNFAKNLNKGDVPEKPIPEKPKAPRKPRAPRTTNSTEPAKTVTEETENLD